MARRRSAPLLPAAFAVAFIVLIGSVAYAPADQDALNPSGASPATANESPLAGPRAQVLIPFDSGGNDSLDFQPDTITVVLGVNNTVVWLNQDSTPHTVTSAQLPDHAQKFDSGILTQGQSFTWTFTVPGTYGYYCRVDPGWMSGTVIVLG